MPAASTAGPAVADSCHRPEEDADRGGASLSAALHDCGTHEMSSAAPARPGFKRAGAQVSLAAAVPQPRAAEHLAPIEAGPLMARDLAPPGPSRGLMTPLRI